jgi:hypothetical protein
VKQVSTKHSEGVDEKPSRDFGKSRYHICGRTGVMEITLSALATIVIITYMLGMLTSFILIIKAFARVKSK